MRLVKDLSIRSKLMLIIMLTSSIALFLACAAFVAFDRAKSKSTMVHNLQILAEVIGNNSIAALEFDDPESAGKTLEALRAEPHIVAACIYRADDREFARYQRRGGDFSPSGPGAAGHRFEDDYLVMFRPVVFNRETIGTVYLQSDLQELRTRLRRFVGIVSGLILGSTFVALVIAGLLQRVISRPILDLARAAREVSARKDYSIRVPQDSRDEMGDLVANFNEMLGQIQEQDAALRESEATNRALLESIPDLMFRMDEKGTFLDYRAKPEELFVPSDEFLGKKVGEVMPLEIARETVACIDRALQTGDMQTFEYQVSADGDWRYYECRVVVSGEREVLAIARNITPNKEAEEARRRAEDELERQQALSMRSDRLRSLGEMAAGIAHELNQPLSGVRGLAEHILIGMQRGWQLSEDKLRERIEGIVAQADRMVHIIEHIRLFAREAGKPEVAPVQVNEVVRSVVDLLGTQFRSHGLELACELAEGLPSVQANRFSLEEVLLNLLSNARDAVEERLPEDGMLSPGRVQVRTGLKGSGPASQVQIEVVDTGVGIPAEILAKVFDPFFTTKDPDKGTGLGLAISRSIVEEFGGRMEIKSAAGEGTTVRISLPVDSHRT